MDHEIVQFGSYHVIRITRDLTVTTDSSGLRPVVQNLLDNGNSRVAVQFTPRSFLDSAAIGAIIVCLELIRKKGGELVLVGPSRTLLGVLETIGLTRLVRVCGTVEELTEGA